MNDDDRRLQEFLARQARDFGCHIELAPDLWALFAVEAADEETNALARSLLAGVSFAHDSGHSEDDRWMLYYVGTAERAAAVHWLEDLSRRTAGEIVPVSPAQRAIICEVAGSNMPHRLAQSLVEMHDRGELGAGSVREAPVVRALLDRLHGREPLCFSAFQLLLSNHLIDMVVLLQQLIAEDVLLQNELMAGSLSRDPFLQSRQSAAAEIRSFLIRFHVINSLDQSKNSSIDNPYAAYLEFDGRAGEISAAIDGISCTLARADFLTAIHAIRRGLYRGEEFNQFNTRTPWMNDEVGYSFRFIRQRLEKRRELSPMDGLYMLERSVAT